MFNKKKIENILDNLNLARLNRDDIAEKFGTNDQSVPNNPNLPLEDDYSEDSYDNVTFFKYS